MTTKKNFRRKLIYLKSCFLIFIFLGGVFFAIKINIKEIFKEIKERIKEIKEEFKHYLLLKD